MAIELYEHQKEAVDKLKNGSILCGDVGSGKSRAAIAYFCLKECGATLESINNGIVNMKDPKDLYIITTARKRDTFEWDSECSPFLLNNIKVNIDSWNNIKKYEEVEGAFFIFDEQRVVGKGAWVKAFLKITKKNRWILLSATPGDTWSDYVPVFIANGYYKSRTEFERRHCVWNRYYKFPKIDKYLETGYLNKLRREILVDMKFCRKTCRHKQIIECEFDKNKYLSVSKDRWDIFNNKPLENPSQYCSALRRVVNSDYSRIEAVKKILIEHPKCIVFYNFDYELNMLRSFCDTNHILYKEWNGHKHEPIPKGDSWIYLVQYAAGNEGWNCIQTDTIIFYSSNYSYRMMHQAAGRIDRMNTPYIDLHYYHLRSKAPLDLAIAQTLKKKQNFNENDFVSWRK